MLYFPLLLSLFCNYCIAIYNNVYLTILCSFFIMHKVLLDIDLFSFSQQLGRVEILRVFLLPVFTRYSGGKKQKVKWPPYVIPDVRCTVLAALHQQHLTDSSELTVSGQRPEKRTVWLKCVLRMPIGKCAKDNNLREREAGLPSGEIGLGEWAPTASAANGFEGGWSFWLILSPSDKGLGICVPRTVVECGCPWQRVCLWAK